MKIKILKLCILLFIVGLFTGCATKTLTNRNEGVITMGIDFRKYTEKGFLFMPDKYFGEYEVKGIITAELHPEVMYKPGKVQEDEEQYYTTIVYSSDNVYTKTIKKVDIDKLLEYIYTLSLEWGGDGFTNFVSTTATGQTDPSSDTSYNYYIISGLVIKRK